MTESDLRWRLRQLPRDIEPTRDLWPAIHAGIEHRPTRTPRRWLGGFAIAASVLLAAGLFWRGAGSGAPMEAESAAATIVASESRAITLEYQAALRQFDGAPIAAQMNQSLSTLDRSVIAIQRAISEDPDSIFLLEQLRKTYSRRLALTQRAVTT